MKFQNSIQLHSFLDAVSKCKSDVYLRSIHGDQYNLKSELSKYVAMGALLQDKYEELEIFCSDKNDEGIFLGYFQDHPEVLGETHVEELI